MTDNGLLVIAEEWQVTLLVDGRASPDRVRRWSLRSHAALAAAVGAAERRLRVGAGRSGARLILERMGEDPS